MIKEIKPFDRAAEVREILQEILDAEEGLEGVAIVGLKKSGATFLTTSTMSGYEKNYLSNFFQAYLLAEFTHEPTD